MIQRLNRAQCVGVLIALALALFTFGRWVVTVGSSHALAFSISLRGPGMVGGMGRLVVPGPGGASVHNGVGLPNGLRTVLPGAQVLSPAAHPAVQAVSRLQLSSVIPAWGRRLIWLGLILVWAICAVRLLGDKAERQGVSAVS